MIRKDHGHQVSRLESELSLACYVPLDDWPGLHGGRDLDICGAWPVG